MSMKEAFLTGVAVAVTASAGIAQSLPEMRMTPAEIQALPLDNNQIGSSNLASVHTKVIFGDPSKAGLYTILLFVPAHTTIQAHSHRDNRVATVVSGEWHLGYGNYFNAKSLRTLPPGSVYSEPAGDNHYAQTDTEAVVMEFPAMVQPIRAISKPRTIPRRKRIDLDFVLLPMP